MAPHVSYDQFVKVESWQVRDAYLDAHGREPAISDMYHNAYRRAFEGYSHAAILAGIYEGAGKPPPAPTPGPAPSRPDRPPRAAAGSRFVAADGAPVLLRYCSAFTLATLFARGGEDQARLYLDWTRDRGFTGVRVLAGALTWAQQTLSSALHGLPRLIDECKQRELGLEVTALTDTRAGGISEPQAKAHLQTVGDLARASDRVIVEVANELGHSTQASYLTPTWAREQGQRSLGGVLWAVGAPVGQDEPIGGHFPGAGGRYLTSHLDRGRPFWEQVRRVRELYALIEGFRVPVLNNEPIGAFSATQPGRRESNPVFFLALGALNSAFGVQGLFHLDAGLKCTVPSPQESACADAFLRGHQLMGDHGGALSYRNTGHAGSPVTAIAHLTRAYSFIDEGQGRGVTLALGWQPGSSIEWGNGWRPGAAIFDEGGLQVRHVQR